jgi:dienelactone hydrolase
MHVGISPKKVKTDTGSLEAASLQCKLQPREEGDVTNRFETLPEDATPGHSHGTPIDANNAAATKAARFSVRLNMQGGAAPTRTQNMNEDDPLTDFTPREITLDGIKKVVHVAGAGPAVIVMTEMPGISPHVARFSRWVKDAGFTVYMPSLFGRDGAVPTAEEGAAIFQRACVSAEFRAFAKGGAGSSPVTLWLRALARLAHEECGGPGVGAIGMCFTGNFALTMLLEPAVLAPVLSQPSLPFDDPAGTGIGADELRMVRQRLERDDLTVMAYRFEGDQYCRAERFAAFSEALGDRFVARVLPDSAANPDTPPFFQRYVATPHSVVTAHLIDEAGQPTMAARDEILSFFANRLGPERQ